MKSITHRLLVLLAISSALSATLTGCSQRVGSLAELGKAMFSGPESVLLSIEEIRELEFAAQYMEVEGSPRILAALNQATPEQLTWRVGPKQFLYSQSGRIVASDSLADFPRQTSERNQDPLLCFRQAMRSGAVAMCPREWQRKLVLEELEGGDGVLKRVWVRSTVSRNEQIETITLLSGLEMPAYRLVEVGEWHISSNGENPIQFENIFWQHAKDGRIIKTRQFISPKVGYMATEEVVPFIGDVNQNSEESE